MVRRVCTPLDQTPAVHGPRQRKGHPYTMCSGTPSCMIPCVLKRCLEWSYDASWPDVSRAARTLVAPTPARIHVADAQHISAGGRGLSVGVAVGRALVPL